MAYYEDLDKLTKAELEELIPLARESVKYHEDAVLWCDAVAANVAAGHRSRRQSRMRHKRCRRQRR